MERSKAHPFRYAVAAGIAIGFLAGIFVMSLQTQGPDFLAHTKPIAERIEQTQTGHNTVRYYTLPVDWLKVIAKAKKELPRAFERESQLGGMKARILTIPRVENGRTQLFYPPAEEITFLPQRLALNSQGHVVSITGAKGAWTGVQLRVFGSRRSL